VPAQTVGLQFLSFHSEFLRPHRRLDIRLSRVSLLQRGAFVESPLIRPTCFSSVSFCRLVLILTFIKVFRGHSDTELRAAFRLRRNCYDLRVPSAFFTLEFLETFGSLHHSAEKGHKNSDAVVTSDASVSCLFQLLAASRKLLSQLLERSFLLPRSLLRTGQSGMSVSPEISQASPSRCPCCLESEFFSCVFVLLLLTTFR
jgi:hypothetical protein